MTGVFIGTFDPFHGAHIGQLMRAYHYKNFTKIYILVDQNPLHKPSANSWQDRLAMIQLSLDTIELPFAYEVTVVSSSLANDFSHHADYKITGIDSLLENLEDPTRIAYIQRWPMLVLSIPGIARECITYAINKLPIEAQKSVAYEYVSETDSSLMNYDFAKNMAVKDTIVHSSYIRRGENQSFLAPAVREYIQAHLLYAAK